MVAVYGPVDVITHGAIQLQNSLMFPIGTGLILPSYTTDDKDKGADDDRVSNDPTPWPFAVTARDGRWTMRATSAHACVHEERSVEEVHAIAHTLRL